MLGTINWLAVLVAGISSFVVGGIWYSPGLFGTIWMKDNGLTVGEVRKKAKEKIVAWTVLFSLLMSASLAMFLAISKDGCNGCIPAVGMSRGATIGLIGGIWTFCATAIHSVFEEKTWRLVLINGFYSIVSLTMMGAIIGVWR
ncbi:MAG: DUF1761 domain-containing protein [Chitinophagaceae bacterium]|nr:DUF1761 domain-containing protein [Chitinophagaceae bacterium]